MMIRAILIAFAALMMVSGCAALNAPIGSNPFEERPAQALGTGLDYSTTAATATLEPTMTATGTPSPTAIDYGDLPITETAVALEQAAVRNEREKLQVRETGQALDRNQAEQTATWGVPTQTAEARGTATAVAWTIATQAAAKTQTAEAAEADLHALELQKETVKADWLPWVYGLATAAVGLVTIFVIAWLRAKILTVRAERAMYDQGKPTPTPAVVPPSAPSLWVPQDVAPEAPGAWVARELPAGVSMDKMRQVAGRYFDFGTFSRSLVEKHKILTDGEWDSLIEFASAPGRKYIVPRNPTIQNSGWNWEPNGQLWLKSFDEVEG